MFIFLDFQGYGHSPESRWMNSERWLSFIILVHRITEYPEFLLTQLNSFNTY